MAGNRLLAAHTVPGCFTWARKHQAVFQFRGQTVAATQAPLQWGYSRNDVHEGTELQCRITVTPMM